MHKTKRSRQDSPTKKRPVVAPSRAVDHQPAGRASGIGLVDALKRAITKSGLTHYAIGKLAACNPTQLDRFMSGERKKQGLGLETAGRIAAALGLQLVTIK